MSAQEAQYQGENRQWMTALPDSTALQMLSIPGTHDTMTLNCGPYTKTQCHNLAQQLQFGVRFLDIRLTKELTVAHRGHETGFNFTDVLNTITEFFTSNPGETIIMRLQNANEKKDDFPQYSDALQACIKTELHRFYLPETTSAWPQLGEMRGKILALECNPAAFDISEIAGHRWAYRWHDNSLISLQDLWDGPDLAEKMTAITSHINAAQNTATATGPLFLNHLSATNGGPANPANWAQIINPQIETQLSQQTAPPGPLGVLIYDFITPTLSAATINPNFPPPISP